MNKSNQLKKDYLSDDYSLIGRELSWLSFNERVLQEAKSVDVPLMERIRFLGIYSSNMDEFFRIRIPNLRRYAKYDNHFASIFGYSPLKNLEEVEKRIEIQHEEFNNTFSLLIKELQSENIILVDENSIPPNYERFILNYFQENVRRFLFPVLLKSKTKIDSLNDSSIYLGVELKKANRIDYSYIEISSAISRFVVLPFDEANNKRYFMFVDDLIRYSLPSIYAIFNYSVFNAFTFKITRDADFSLSSDISKSLLEIVSDGVSERTEASPVRFIHDKEMNKKMVDFLRKVIHLPSNVNCFPGGRYHNFRDFINFSGSFVRKAKYRHLYYPPFKQLRVPHIDKISLSSNLLNLFQKKDVLLHYPYCSFDTVINLLYEASINPLVESISLSVYRLANGSRVALALENAVKNGKTVNVNIELKARFDEESNIKFSKKLQRAGANLILGFRGMKVHAKLLLIEFKKQNNRINKKDIAYIATGNFHENTAKIYSDLGLFFTDKKLVKEVKQIFKFFKKNYVIDQFKDLWVAPINMRNNLLKAIRQEIDYAKNGKKALIFIKVNNITDKTIINELYKASQSGVKIRLIVRSMFSVKVGIKGLSENIKAKSIVGRFLEHSRIFYFYNNKEKDVYMGSADLMERNLNNRLEVIMPIRDTKIKQEVIDYLEMQWKDNVKARIIDINFTNQIDKNDRNLFSSQEKFYDYLCKRHQI